MTRHNPAQEELRMDCARRIAAYARQGLTDLAPGIEQTDVAFFTDPHRHELEVRKLFRETPLVACLSRDLPGLDTFRLFDEPGVPIVVTRGKDGAVRAFLNICPHRGARVVREPCGKSSRFTCRFHGWTFDTAGKAIGVPMENQFCGLIGDQKQMVSIPAEERHGFVFVQASPGSIMDLDAHLAGFGEQLAPLDLDQAELVFEAELHVSANWKYTLDTYFENYHLPVLHRETLAKVFAHHLNIFETWGPHHRFTWPQQNIHEWKDKPESEWPIWALPLTHFVFPNTNMAVGSTSPSGSYISIHRLFPKSVGELVTKISIYAAYGVASPQHLTELEQSFEAARRAVETEDYAVTGEAWAALAALPPGSTFPVGRHEIGVQNFHRNVRKHAYGELVETDPIVAIAAE